MSENMGSKVSCSTDLSPTALFDPRDEHVGQLTSHWPGGRCTRGSAGLGGWWGGLYRYPTQYPPWTHIELYLALRPYPWPNEGELRYIDEVSYKGSRKGPELTQNDLQNDPQMTSRMTLQTGPQMALR